MHTYMPLAEIIDPCALAWRRGAQHAPSPARVNHFTDGASEQKIPLHGMAHSREVAQRTSRRRPAPCRLPGPTVAIKETPRCQTRSPPLPAYNYLPIRHTTTCSPRAATRGAGITLQVFATSRPAIQDAAAHSCTLGLGMAKLPQAAGCVCPPCLPHPPGRDAATPAALLVRTPANYLTLRA